MTTYFKLLGRSSSFFIERAKEHKGEPIVQKAYLVSSLIHSWLLLEAYVNDVSDTLTAANIDIFTKAVLSHESFAVTDKGEIIKSTSHMPTLKRVLFVLRYFSKVDIKAFRQTKLWEEVTWAEEFRNQMIHPKLFHIDQIDLKKAERTRACVVELIVKMNKSIFRRKISLD